jgi:hypothetical protein
MEKVRVKGKKATVKNFTRASDFNRQVELL